MLGSRSVLAPLFVAMLSIANSAWATFTLIDVIQDPAAGLGTRGMAACDANQDGIADLVIANVFESNLRGAVHIYDGVTSAPLATFTGPQPSGLFGTALTKIGDVNGDGVTELFIGAPGDGVSQGYIFDCVKAIGGFASPLIHTFSSQYSYDQLGTSVAVVSDPTSLNKMLIIGAPAAPKSSASAAAGAGRANIYLLSVTSSNYSVSSALYSISGPALGSSFAHDISTGDVNGDSIDDILIGAPRYNGSRGIVKIFDGTGSFTTAYSGGTVAPISLPDLTPPADTIGSIYSGQQQPGQWFGASIATVYSAGVANRARAVIGAPYYGVYDLAATPPLFATQAGRVLVAKLVQCSQQPCSDSWSWVYNGTQHTSGQGHYWGFDVAVVGDKDAVQGAGAIQIGGPGAAGAPNAGASIALLSDETSPIPFTIVDFQPPGVAGSQRGISVSNPGVLSANGRPILSLATPNTGSSSLKGISSLFEVPSKGQLSSAGLASWAPTNKMGCVDPLSGLAVPDIGMAAKPKVGNSVTFNFSGFPPLSKILFWIGTDLDIPIEISSNPAAFNCLIGTFPDFHYPSIQADSQGNATYTLPDPTGGSYILESILNGLVIYAQAGVLSSSGNALDFMSKQIEIKIGN